MSHDRRSESRRALTLVEMLVGMAITLIMMAAVVNLFANVSGGVSNRRAAIGMNGTLRQARSLLQRDLAGATCPAVSWQNPEAGNGYLEIIEGQWSDSNPSLLTSAGFLNQVDASNNPIGLQSETSIIPRDNSGNLAQYDNSGTQVGTSNGLGDYDDILALTVRSDGEPFAGRGRVFNQAIGEWEDGAIDALEGEVIWYAVENPADTSLGEPGLRTVYRRTFLISTQLGFYSGPTTASSPIRQDPFFIIPSSANTVALRQQYLTEFQLNYDISVRIEGNRLVPNTLSDLTKRENRFAHRYDSSLSDLGYPHELSVNAIRPNAVAPFFPTTSISPLRPFGLPFETVSNRQGEDIILNDVLAWDVRVFDPGAPLYDAFDGASPPNRTGVTVQPGDVKWNPADGPAIGYGAFVDLGWNPLHSWSSNEPSPLFHRAHQAGWHPRDPLTGANYPAVYDTWSTHYESDGLNQDILTDNNAGIDQGTNGFDDIVAYDLDDDPNTASTIPMNNAVNPPVPIALNGTDDVGERETSPPYDVKLPAVKVIMRAYERDSRQIRETSVTQSFQ